MDRAGRIAMNAISKKTATTGAGFQDQEPEEITR